MKQLFKNIQVFNIGKHKNEEVIEVVKTDPDYVNWLLKNLKGYKKEKAQLQEIKDCLHNELLKQVQEDTQY